MWKSSTSHIILPQVISGINGRRTRPSLGRRARPCLSLFSKRKKWNGNTHSPSLALTLTLTVVLSPNHYTTRNFGCLCTQFCLVSIAQTSCMCRINLRMRRTQVWRNATFTLHQTRIKQMRLWPIFSDLKFCLIVLYANDPVHPRQRGKTSKRKKTIILSQYSQPWGTTSYIIAALAWTNWIQCQLMQLNFAGLDFCLGTRHWTTASNWKAVWALASGLVSTGL